MNWKDWFQIFIPLVASFAALIFHFNTEDNMAKKQTTKLADGLFEAQRQQIQQLTKEVVILRANNTDMRKRLNKQGTRHAQQQKELGVERTDIRQSEKIISEQSDKIQFLGKELNKSRKDLATQRLELVELREPPKESPKEEPPSDFLPPPKGVVVNE